MIMHNVSAPFLLFLVFLTLKLTGYITWSWVWVIAPLWVPIIVVVCVITGIGIYTGLSNK